MADVVPIGGIEGGDAASLAPGKQKQPFDADVAQGYKIAAEALEQGGVVKDAIPKGLMELAEQNFTHPITVNSLKESTEVVKTQIQDLKSLLNFKDDSSRVEFESKLDNNLGHIDDELRNAFEKIGFDDLAALSSPAQTGIEKFLGYLTKAQSRLEGMGGQISELGKNPNASHADYLKVQYNVGLMQQELELFTNLLNKGTEAVKTMMNVQI
jgi:hypothetical protein